MDDSIKNIVDVGAGTLTVSALMDIVPEATALLSLVWICLRIYETETVQILLGRKDPWDDWGD